MLTSLEARTISGDVLTLPLGDISSGYIVQDITGLGPVKATLVSSSFANSDGAQYHSSRRDARNILFKIGFDSTHPTLTVQQLRNALYKFFMPKTEISLTFILDETYHRDIVARVETFETPLFAKEPLVDISVVCFNPDFYLPDAVLIGGLTTEDTTETMVTYAGTVDTGIIFKLLVDRSISGFTIYHRTAENLVRLLVFTYALIADDILTISTVPGSKFITLTRAGVDTSVLYSMSPQSNWIELQPGDNAIRVYAEGAPIPFTLEYITKYGGL